jgi:hypothetical protein
MGNRFQTPDSQNRNIWKPQTRNPTQKGQKIVTANSANSNKDATRFHVILKQEQELETTTEAKHPHLSGQILKHCRQINRRSSSNSSGILPCLEEPRNSAHRELQAGLVRPGDGLLPGTLPSPRHACTTTTATKNKQQENY